jgi:hypothetical protein
VPEYRTKTGTFAPGHSGNPGGRRPLTDEERALWEAMHKGALDRLPQLVKSENEKVALQATMFVIERVEGKEPTFVLAQQGRSSEELVREAMQKLSPELKAIAIQALTAGEAAH